MIGYRHANILLDILIEQLNSAESLDKLIHDAAKKDIPKFVGLVAARELLKPLEEQTNICFDKGIVIQIINKYISRGVRYLNSMEHYDDISIMNEAYKYKIKFVKLSQKTSQIKNRRSRDDLKNKKVKEMSEQERWLKGEE